MNIKSLTSAVLLAMIPLSVAVAGTNKSPEKAKAPTAPALRVENDDVYRPDLYPVATAQATASAQPTAAIPPPKTPMEAVDPALQSRNWSTSSEWLSDSLKGWGKSVNWQVRWTGGTDRRLDTPLNFQGRTFRQAVEAAIALYINSDSPLLIDVYESQRLIFIKEAK